MKVFLRGRLAGFALFLTSAALATAALQPGPAQSSNTNGVFTLENNFLAVSWVATNGTLWPVEFDNNLATQSWTQAGSELFSLAYTSAGSGGITSSVSLTSSDCILVSGPQLQASQPNSQSTRVGDQLPGQELVASFLDPSSGIQVDWRVVLRDGANYVRQFLTIHGTNSRDEIDAVELLDYATAATPAQVGTVSGSPVVAGQAFFGGETPFAESTLGDNSVSIDVPTALPLGPNITYEFSAVAGVFPVGQLRRSFLYYLERERAAPYWQLLHFNSWYDVIYDVSEAEMLTAISACELELHQRRGVALDSYAMDDGWYDPSQGFWAIDTNKFPHQFALLQSNVTAVGSHLGLWISPLGGYPPRQQELVQDAINEGIVTSNLDLSIPTYYTWWTNECATFILSNAMNYFKWDNAGNGVTPHFMALLRAADALRGYSTNLFINVTNGSWPSPFWLNHVDSTWHGGTDTGAAGVGDAREQWITYRDDQTWLNVVQAAPLYPLTSLMLGGIIQANGGGAISQAGTDLRHEARSFFGSGVNLQELYLTPSMLTSDSWNDIADAAAWARTNASVLADSHWVGGDPNHLDVYGWAAWTPEKGTVALRNPSSQTNCISFDIGAAFELPADAPTTYNLSPAYADQRPTVTQLQAGQPAFITLLPFEVLVFDALPAPDTPQPPTVTMQLPPPVRYCGAAVSLEAAAEGTLPISFHWNFNGVPIAFATNATLLMENLDYTAAGNYSVTVSNTVGVATSTAAAIAMQTPGPYAAAILADQPVGWWRMDDTIRPTIVDSGDSHNGTSFGNVSFGVPGALAIDTDTAIHFDGSNGTRIDVPYAPELNSASFSFECWARVTGGAGTYRSPLASRDDSPLSGYICYAANNNSWEFWTGTGHSWDIIYGPTVVSGRWTHLVGTYDGSNKSFYVNSQLVGATQSTYLPNVNMPLSIGAGASEGDGYFFFTGDVDEVAVYDYALSAAQVQAHYLASVSGTILPFNVMGGGAYCAGGAGVAIGLDGSQSGISYQLQLNGNNLGAPVTGTGSALSFGNQTAAGAYTVVAIAGSTGNTTTMNGSATVTVAAWPTIANVTGGGAYWTNGIGVAVGLDGSQSGSNYQLQLNGNNLGAPVAGTGGALSFGNQTAAGTYTVVATVRSLGCANNMNGSATVTVSPLPTALLEWQWQYFNCTNCVRAQLNVDADGTGQNNLFKYVAGLDPTNPASVFVIKTASVPNQPQWRNLVFNPVIAGRTYTPQFGTDLVSGVWLPLTTYTGPVTNGAGTQVTLTDLTATNQSKFYRIDISLP